MKYVKMLIVALFISLSAMAQEEPPDPPADDEVPIGTDIAVLIAVGGLYFYRDLFRVKSCKNY